MTKKQFYKVWSKKHGGSFRTGCIIYPVSMAIYDSHNTEPEIQAWIENYESEKIKRAFN